MADLISNDCVSSGIPYNYNASICDHEDLWNFYTWAPAEVCGNGVDDDCNDSIDEGCSPKEPGACLAKTGSDPILLSSKSVATEPYTDFSVQFISKLAFTRTYNSNDLSIWSSSSTPSSGVFGLGWHHEWEKALTCQFDFCTVWGGTEKGLSFQLGGAVTSLDGTETWAYYPPYNQANTGNFNYLVGKPDGSWVLFLSSGETLHFQTVCDACSATERQSSSLCQTVANGGTARLVKVVDPAGNSVSVNYDRPSGLLIGLYDDLGHELELRGTNACGNGLATELRLDRNSGSGGTVVVTYGYTGQKLDRVTDADGHVLRFYTYNTDGLIRAVQNEGGQAIAEFTYDQNGRAIGLVDSDSSTYVNYEASGGIAVTEYFRGPVGDTSSTSVRTLDYQGRVTSISDGCACGSAKTLKYDSSTYTCSVDSLGRVVRETSRYAFEEPERRVVFQGGSCEDAEPYPLPVDSKLEVRSFNVARPIAQYYSMILDRVSTLYKPSTVNASGGVMEYYDYDQAANPSLDPSGYTCVVTPLPAGSVVCRYISYGYVYDSPISSRVERHATFFSYDAHGRLTRTYGAVNLDFLSPDDVPPIEERTYWADTDSLARRGRLHEVKRYASPTAAPLVTSYDYDIFGVFQVTDERGGVTTIIKDGRGRPTFVITAGGQPYETRYYSDLKRRLNISPGGATTRSTYDSMGRLQKVEQLSGDPELSGANPVLGWSEIYTYDAAGNRIHTERRDAQANLTWQQDRAFDVHHRVVWESNPESPASVRTASYDASGFLTETTDEEGRSVLFTPDGIGRVMQVREVAPNGRSLDVATYTYQANADAISAVTDGNSPPHTDGYLNDDFGRIAQVQPVPMSGAFFYTYDARGNVVRRSKPDGSEPIVYAYDGLDRLVTLNTAGLSYAYTYDTPPYPGRLASIQEPDRTVSFTYDAMGHVTNETIHENGISTTLETTYVYDADGAVAEISYPSGLHIQYARDSATRMVVQVNNITDGTHYAEQVTHLPAGPVTSLVFGNGFMLSQTFNRRYEPVTISSGPLSLSYTMSRAGEVSSISDSAVGYGFSELDYEYDGVGNRTFDATDTVQSNYTIIQDRVTQRQVAGKSTHAYGYDGLGSLSAIEQFDSTGTTLTAVVCLRHDSLGRMVLYGNKSEGFAAGATTCTQDSEVSEPIARFKYDSRNRRIARQDATIGQWTYIVSDARGRSLSEVALVNGVWTPVRDYVWLDNRPLAQIEYPGPVGSTEGYVYYYHLDHIGLPRALTNQAGQTIWSGMARPYGDIVENAMIDPLSGRMVVTNLRLPGQYDERLLSFLGLQGPYYNWNRWYLPSIGRYLELDPLATMGGLNRGYGPDWYGYAVQNPYGYVDPFGLNALGARIGGAIGGGVGGFVGFIFGGGGGVIATVGTGGVGFAAIPAGAWAGAGAGVGLGAGMGAFAGNKIGDWADGVDWDKAIADVFEKLGLRDKVAPIPVPDPGKSDCEQQYERDVETCRCAKSRACYGQAAVRKVLCEQGLPVPPLNF